MFQIGDRRMLNADFDVGRLVSEGAVCRLELGPDLWMHLARMLEDMFDALFDGFLDEVLDLAAAVEPQQDTFTARVAPRWIPQIAGQFLVTADVQKITAKAEFGVGPRGL